MHRDELDETTYDLLREDERRWRSSKGLSMSRRRFLELLGGAGAGVALQACEPRPAPSGRSPSPTASPKTSPYVKLVPGELFIDHGTSVEMRWEQMSRWGYLVGNDLFFVRNHTRTARIDASSWKLRIEGSGVGKPLELGYDELLSLPSATSVVRCIECAGNGRSFFRQAHGTEAQGTQWKLGGIGVAEWTGVPLGEVLERAGLRKTARDVMPEGADELRVRRPIPVAKALADDTLLVFAMNGEPLPPDHGFPVRVLVPGWVGVANVKWVDRIEVSEEPLYSDWNTKTYVLVGEGYRPEGPARGPALTTQTVKSALELAWPARLAPGRHTIRGRSWSGQGRIAKVEHSLDGGKTWQACELAEPNTPLAWVRWSFSWEPSPGEYEIRTRAADEKGNTQPQAVPFNQQGYLYGAVVGHPVRVG
jgi:sulfane dehydrogenase subunit SoxC